MNELDARIKQNSIDAGRIAEEGRKLQEEKMDRGSPKFGDIVILNRSTPADNRVILRDQDGILCAFSGTSGGILKKQSIRMNDYTPTGKNIATMLDI